MLTYHGTTFSDDQNDPVRSQIHVEGTDYFYNPANPDLVLSGHFIHNVQIDERTGEWDHYDVPYDITVS